MVYSTDTLKTPDNLKGAWMSIPSVQRIRRVAVTTTREDKETEAVAVSGDGHR